MAELRLGNREAAGELIELLWPDLRRRRDCTDHTWQPILEPINAGGPDTHPHRNDNNVLIGLDAHVMMRLLTHPVCKIRTEQPGGCPATNTAASPNQEPSP